LNYAFAGTVGENTNSGGNFEKVFDAVLVD